MVTCPASVVAIVIRLKLMKTILSLLILFSLAAGCSKQAACLPAPSANAPWVIRTFGDRPDLWESLKLKIAAPVGRFGFLADVRYIDDKRYYDLTGVDLINALPADYRSGFVFAANGDTSPAGENVLAFYYFSPDSDNPADYERPPSSVPESDLQTVLCLPDAVQDLENNFSIGNVSIEDVLVNLPEDGIHRPLEY